jgi:hypothetical protein
VSTGLPSHVGCCKNSMSSNISSSKGI